MRLQSVMQPRVALVTSEDGSASEAICQGTVGGGGVGMVILTGRVVEGVGGLAEDLSPHGELDGESDDGALDAVPDTAEAGGWVDEIHDAAVDGDALLRGGDGVSVWFSVVDLL